MPREYESPNPRYREYLSLMKEAGVTDALHDGRVFLFPVAGWGHMGAGWRVAITWREQSPPNQLASLDDFRKTGPEWEYGYRLIEGNWYLRIVW